MDSEQQGAGVVQAGKGGFDNPLKRWQKAFSEADR
jgi:hypothetical protein